MTSPAFITGLEGKLSEYGREKALWIAGRDSWTENDLRRMAGRDLVEGGDAPIMPIIAGGAGSFSDYVELKILDHIFNDPSFTAPTPYLALWTAGTTLAENSTGSTASEATYTTYARYAITAADMAAAATGAKASGQTITMAACTAGTTTVTQFMVADAVTAGNCLIFGTCTSTVISSTQTPPTIASGQLSVTLD